MIHFFVKGGPIMYRAKIFVALIALAIFTLTAGCGKQEDAVDDQCRESSHEQVFVRPIEPYLYE